MISALEKSALAQLTLVRFREFIREPEAVFWVFVFPILLAAGLGLAFRSRPPDVLRPNWRSRCGRRSSSMCRPCPCLPQRNLCELAKWLSWSSPPSAAE